MNIHQVKSERFYYLIITELKNLVLLTSAYPIYNDEYFLEDEINILSENFKKIYIICLHVNQPKVERVVPDNIVVIELFSAISFINKLAVCSFLFSKELANELNSVKKYFGIKLSFPILKIALNEYAKGLFVLKQLKKTIKDYNLKSTDTVFYSYWHDHKALGLALLKNENPNYVCVARAHGWEIDFKRHLPAYLPFKEFIISKLDKTFTVSECGKQIFNSLHNDRYSKKIEVCRLGKINENKPLENKLSNEVLICSCSNLIPLKRINLIIAILSKLNFKHLTWVHFGDGPIRKQLEALAEKELVNLNYVFKGRVQNSEILDFYADNYVDMFINVSESEGIPVSIMEAQSAGIPVLATNVGGAHEIVTNEYGFLIEKDFDVNYAVQVINQYLQKPEKVIVQKRNASYNNWLENYNAKKNYESFYRSLLKLNKLNN